MAGISDLARTARTRTGSRPENGMPSVPTLTKPLAVLAFWSAIALPALYLPFLAVGLETVDDLLVFLGLFGLHTVTLIIGQSHRTS